MELNLLEKTELRITNLKLNNVNLTTVAEIVAQTLGLPADKVLVIDVRENHICLDILEKTVTMQQITGKEAEILTRLQAIDGLELSDESRVDSTGIMGLINIDRLEAGAVIAATQAMVNDIERNVLSRALVYSTGFEVKQGMIKDTNAPFLVKFLTRLGYRAEFGGILDDNLSAIRYKLQEAADKGYGLVITTGGVGAEDKDFSIEALTAVDPDAATLWLAKFAEGQGRHVKSGIRTGVGQLGITTYISLPGPHDEVTAAAAAIKQNCCAGERIDKIKLANEVANILRDKLRGKKWSHHHYGHHGQ